jgi:hypothetical protein
MKKFFVIALALALTAGAAYANYCARDIVPAATLLVPYAVVDMNGSTPDPNGYSTLLTVTNVSSEAQLIHITVWSALSEPVVDWDEVLTGYDVWSINFRDMLTGHFDYFDTGSGFWSGTTGPAVTPFGPATNDGWSYPLPGPQDVDFPGVKAGTCYYPYDYHPEYGTGIVAGLRADIFAVDFQLYCEGFNPDYAVNYVPWQIAIDPDDALWFYVTVDAVNMCSTNFPSSSAYWNGNIVDDDNVLLGEVYYLNFLLNLSEALPAVHLEYDPDAVGDGDFQTFWELAVDQGYNEDGLEPLGTAFAFRYYNSGGVSSNLMLWKSQWEFEWYYGYTWADACGWYAYYAWDENEKSRTRSGGPSGFDRPEPNVIPFETQKVPLTASNWNGLMSGNGWMLLVFEPSLGWGSNIEAYAAVQHNFGGFSAAIEAATMANYWCFNQQVLSPNFYLGVNYNYTDGEGVDGYDW